MNRIRVKVVQDTLLSMHYRQYMNSLDMNVMNNERNDPHMGRAYVLCRSLFVGKVLYYT